VKHYIITRINFKDLELLDKYLKVTKEVLIPCLKSQTVKNFTLAIITNPETVDYLKEQIDFPFIPFYGNSINDHLIEEGVNIQTRHDCDDFMSKGYVSKIQKEYEKNFKKHSCFLIQAQPTLFDYSTKTESKMKPYSHERCSMFLSLCQEKVERHVFERKHGQMYEVTPTVITLPEGYAKWIIHGNNKSVSKK
jgi:hypothetical protein